MRNKIFIHVFFVILSFLATLISTYPKVEVTQPPELKTLSCGWPLKFVVHDDSLLDSSILPWKYDCGFLRGRFDQGSTKEFNWQYFIIDIAFFYLLILALYHGKDMIIKKR